MIRPFKLRDLVLVYRLSEQTVLLNAESALTTVAHPLQTAVKNMLFGGRNPTYVWKAKKGRAAGYVQLHLAKDSPNAQIISLGWESKVAQQDNLNTVDENIWLPFLDELVAVVGQRGIHSLMVQVSETGPELPVLRRAGFAVYTRQDIWVADLIDNKYISAILHSRRAVDDWDIQLLYANIVPRLIQLVEPMPPLRYGKSWILREDNELAAFVHLNEGQTATWMRVFIHPNANIPAEEIIGAAYQMKPPKPGHPVYCCVGRYQSWLQTALQEIGFRFWGSHAVMVKHTVQHAQTKSANPSAGLEARVVTSSPLVQRLTARDAESLSRRGIDKLKRPLPETGHGLRSVNGGH